MFWLGLWLGGAAVTFLMCLLVIILEKKNIFANSTYSRKITSIGLVLAIIIGSVAWPIFWFIIYLSEIVLKKRVIRGNMTGEEFYRKIPSDDIDVEEITDEDRRQLAENVKSILKNSELVENVSVLNTSEPSQVIKEGYVACIKCGELFDISLRKCPKCGLNCMTFAGKLFR